MTSHRFRFSGPLRLAGGLLLFLGASIVPATLRADWPRFLNQGFDGSATEMVEVDWTREPRLRWSLDVGEGYGLGSLGADRYYHFDAAPLSSGFPTERLRAIDRSDGSELWVSRRPLVYRDLYGYEAGPRGTPTIAGDRLITMGVSGEVCCRSIEGGKLLWNVDTHRAYGVVQNFFGAGASPLILDGMAIVMVGGSPATDANIPPGMLDRVSPNGSLLVAFDLETGRERWKSGDDLASYSSPRTIELAGKMYVLVFARDHLWLIDPQDGTVRWKYAHRADLLESVNAITPVVDGDLVWISECYQIGSVLLKVSPEGAEVVWRDPPENRREQSLRSHWSTPVLVSGFLYGCSGRNAPDSDFRCVDFKTGKVRWADGRRRRSAVTRAGDFLVVLEEYGQLQVLRPNPAGIVVVAQWDLGQAAGERPALRFPCWAAPIVDGDVMLVRGDTQVLCLELSGRQAGRGGD